MGPAKARRDTRRRLLQGAAGIAALGVGFPMLNFASYRVFADSETAYMEQDNPWQDDESWWQQQDREMQERESRSALDDWRRTDE